ncbi:MAG: hypothetical protein JSW22_06140 [Chloroflexota bacterium]|nr:MAG: hypothetical protein JSW22_06140 [Chloroflexota bacterium]
MMSESQKKILEMLANNKISADEAYRLLSALEPEGSAPEGTAKTGMGAKTKPKCLRCSVTSSPKEEEGRKGGRVNVRVPIALIRSGVKLTSLLPREARDKVTDALHEKGIDFDMRNVKPEDLDELVEALSELEVDIVSSDGEVVKVSVE